MSRQEICIAVKHFDHFRSRPWGANIPPLKVFLRCDQAALVSCRLIALLRKAPYRDAAKKVAEFGQAGMIERSTAGTRHPHHALIIRSQFQPKCESIIASTLSRRGPRSLMPDP